MKIWTLCLACALLTACGSRIKETNTAPVQRYQMHGEVIRVSPQDKTATIKAEAIKGWMGAMTMEYPVKQPQDLSALHANDCVNATVFVQGTDFWIGEIQPQTAPPTGCVAAPPPETPSPAPAAPAAPDKTK